MADHQDPAASGSHSFLGSIGSAIGRGFHALFGSHPSPGPEAEPHPSQVERPAAGAHEEPTGQDSFLHGKDLAGFPSSNVTDGDYDASENKLELGYKKGKRYAYHDVSPKEASSFYHAGSKGTWVWDHLRLRGTVFGHQKPYTFLGGKSSGKAPKYTQDAKHAEEHRQIGPEGMTPLSWRQGKGPYDSHYGVPHTDEPHPWGESPEERETKPGSRPRPTAAEQLAAAFESEPEPVPTLQMPRPSVSRHRRQKRAGSVDAVGMLKKLGSVFGMGKKAKRKAGGGHLADGGPVLADPGEVAVKEDVAKKPANAAALEAMNEEGKKSPKVTHAASAPLDEPTLAGEPADLTGGGEVRHRLGTPGRDNEPVTASGFMMNAGAMQNPRTRSAIDAMNAGQEGGGDHDPALEAMSRGEGLGAGGPRMACGGSINSGDFGHHALGGRQQSPEFKSWFGDVQKEPAFASKVRNEDGTPKTVYHGTTAKPFDQFQTTEGGSYDFGAHFGTIEQASSFVPAAAYTPSFKGHQAADNGRIYPVNLSIKNPLRLPDLGSWNWTSMVPALREKGIEIPAEIKAKREAMLPVWGKEFSQQGHHEWEKNALRDVIESYGYDGITYLNTAEGVDGKSIDAEVKKRGVKAPRDVPEDVLRQHGAKDSYIAMRGTQIKSTHNRGTYSQTDPNIHKARGGIMGRHRGSGGSKPADFAPAGMPATGLDQTTAALHELVKQHFGEVEFDEKNPKNLRAHHAGRYIYLNSIGREGQPFVNVDFEKDDKSGFEQTGKTLEGGSLDFLRSLQSFAGGLKGKGIGVRSVGSNDKRSRIYEKGLKSAGFKADPDVPNLYFGQGGFLRRAWGGVMGAVSSGLGTLGSVFGMGKQGEPAAGASHQAPESAAAFPALPQYPRQQSEMGGPGGDLDRTEAPSMYEKAQKKYGVGPAFAAAALGQVASWGATAGLSAATGAPVMTFGLGPAVTMSALAAYGHFKGIKDTDPATQSDAPPAATPAQMAHWRNQQQQHSARGGAVHMKGGGGEYKNLQDSIYEGVGEQNAKAIGYQNLPAFGKKIEKHIGKLRFDQGPAVVVPHKSLGIPRTMMPQIAKENLPHFLETLKAKGIVPEMGTLPVGQLQFAQNEIGLEKIAANSLKSDKKLAKKVIIVSTEKDGSHKVMDGNHGATGMLTRGGPEYPAQVMKIPLPFDEALKEMRAYEKVGYKAVGAKEISYDDPQGHFANAPGPSRQALSDVSPAVGKMSAQTQQSEQMPAVFKTGPALGRMAPHRATGGKTSIPAAMGTKRPDFPAPPPLWKPEYMEMYPKDAVLAARKEIAARYPGGERGLSGMAESVGQYVYDYSLASRNVGKRVMTNLADRGGDSLDMDQVLATTRKATDAARAFQPVYPTASSAPGTYQEALQSTQPKPQASARRSGAASLPAIVAAGGSKPPRSPGGAVASAGADDGHRAEGGKTPKQILAEKLAAANRTVSVGGQTMKLDSLPPNVQEQILAEEAKTAPSTPPSPPAPTPEPSRPKLPTTLPPMTSYDEDEDNEPVKAGPKKRAAAPVDPTNLEQVGAQPAPRRRNLWDREDTSWQKQLREEDAAERAAQRAQEKAAREAERAQEKAERAAEQAQDKADREYVRAQKQAERDARRAQKQAENDVAKERAEFEKSQNADMKAFTKKLAAEEKAAAKERAEFEKKQNADMKAWPKIQAQQEKAAADEKAGKGPSTGGPVELPTFGDDWDTENPRGWHRKGKAKPGTTPGRAGPWEDKPTWGGPSLEDTGVPIELPDTPPLPKPKKKRKPAPVPEAEGGFGFGGGGASAEILAGTLGHAAGGSAGAAIAMGFVSGGPAGAAVAGASVMLGKLKDTGDQVVSTFKGLVFDPASVLRGLAGSVIPQVTAFNPATVERFNLALDNVSASAGRFLEPIITELEGFANEVNVLLTAGGGDFKAMIDEILPPIRDFGRTVMVSFVGALRDGATYLTPIFHDLAPLGHSLGVVVKEVMASVIPMGKAALEGGAMLMSLTSPIFGFSSNLGDAVKSLQSFTAWTIVAGRALLAAANPASLLNAESRNALLSPLQEQARIMRQMQAGAGGPVRGEMTYAAQPARHIGIEEVGMEARRSAFSQGENIQQTIANNTNRTNELLRQIAQLIARGNNQAEVDRLTAMMTPA